MQRSEEAVVRIIGFAAQAVMTVGVMLTLGLPVTATEAERRDAEIIVRS
jgi:energy-converting hydrogenase Eha subunit A